jgi:spermidine synthase
MAAAAVGLVVVQGPVFAHLLERLQFKNEFGPGKEYRFIVQNRSGIIAVEPGQPDIMHGGGVYDGRFNLDPVTDSNGIRRAYMVAALHPDPQEILEIGLATGSWARAVTDHPAVRRFTSVEINPGYLDVIQNYPSIDSIRTDPRVTIHVDDGRRWLLRDPEAKFDFILMNTSFHWREHITALLSREFLTLCQAHLKPGGVIYFNSTGAEDTVYTAAQVFRYVTSYRWFVAASDSPFAMTRAEKCRNLLRFRHHGKPVFGASHADERRVLNLLADSQTTDRAAEVRARSDLWTITDDNMATEFKINKKWYDPSARWGEQLWGRWVGNAAAAGAPRPFWRED